jgi:hypothetical protein
MHASMQHQRLTSTAHASTSCRPLPALARPRTRRGAPGPARSTASHSAVPQLASVKLLEQELMLPLPSQESAVDDPHLHNPLLRQQRLSTGWFGVLVEFEGVSAGRGGGGLEPTGPLQPRRMGKPGALGGSGAQARAWRAPGRQGPIRGPYPADHRRRRSSWRTRTLRTPRPGSGATKRGRGR